jgi:hypothetical protein
MRGRNVYSYMYYRLASWYFKIEGKGKISYGATAIVTLSQVLILTDVIGFVILDRFPQAERSVIIHKFYPFYLVFILIVAFINDKVYKNKFEIFHERWKNETGKPKNMGNIVIILLILLPLILIPVLLNLFDYSL